MLRISLVIILLLLSNCRTGEVISHKSLYEATIAIEYNKQGQKTNLVKYDTINTVYWDYIEMSNTDLIKKDATVIASNVKSYSFISKKKIKL